ncbi:MAG: 30S ribosomal protein S27e [Candidatus Hadarchaeota archaeon]
MAKFLKVRCTSCGNEQSVYSHATSAVKCLVCGKTLASPKGGKAEIKATVLGDAEEGA